MRFAPLLSFILQYIFLLLIVPIVILLFINILYVVYKDLKAKSTDLYQYKIINFYYTFTIISFYIISFILFIYGLRIVYINNTLDLRILYGKMCNLIIEFIQLSFILQAYYALLLILILLLILFIIVNIQTLCYKEFFKLHIFLSDTNPTRHGYKSKFRSKYTNYLNTWGLYSGRSTDILSGYIDYLVYKFKFRLAKFPKLKITKFERVLFYIFGSNYYKLIRHKEKKIIKNINKITSSIFSSKYYGYFFYLSPIFVILYDCYFHNWVLTHIFYYMIIYSPLIIIKRITNCTFSLYRYSITFFRQFYYEYEQDKFMFCISKELKGLMIDSYLLRELQHNFDLFWQGIQESNYVYIILNMAFVSHDVNMYRSEEDVTIIKEKDNKFYRMIYEHKRGNYALGEEWIVLEDKHNIERPYVVVEFKQKNDYNIDKELEEAWAILENREKDENNSKNLYDSDKQKRN